MLYGVISGLSCLVSFLRWSPTLGASLISVGVTPNFASGTSLCTRVAFWVLEQVERRQRHLAQQTLGGFYWPTVLWGPLAPLSSASLQLAAICITDRMAGSFRLSRGSAYNTSVVLPYLGEYYLPPENFRTALQRFCPLKIYLYWHLVGIKRYYSSGKLYYKYLTSAKHRNGSCKLFCPVTTLNYLTINLQPLENQEKTHWKDSYFIPQ